MKRAYIPLGCTQQGRITPTKFPSVGVASQSRTCFARSLSEAFPGERANAVEVYRAPWRFGGAVRVVVCLSAAALIGALIAWGV